MNILAAALTVFTLISIGFWYREFDRRTEDGSAYQLFLGAPRLARLSPRGRRIAAHVGIAAPAALLITVSIVLVAVSGGMA
jgi:hypothetical protein